MLTTGFWTTIFVLAFEKNISKDAALAASFVWGLAQLGERLNGIQEVSGSIPLGSTDFAHRGEVL